MNIYDFDGTIYRGDSTRDFFGYCLKEYPKTWLSLPWTAVCALGFILKIVPKTKFKQNFYRFLRGVPDTARAVEAFWDAHMDGIEVWYLRQKQPEDLIISASPEFLLRSPCKRLGILPPIASLVDEKTGRYTGVNCHGREKVRRLYEQVGECHIKRFYSDSLSDTPLAELADQSFFVKKGEVAAWPQTK